MKLLATGESRVCVVHSAPAVAAVAEKSGVPPAAPTATIDRFNTPASTAVDEDFSRRKSAQARYCGDTARTRRSP
jgi:3-oxosteroid 1-dehydrogenase